MIAANSWDSTYAEIIAVLEDKGCKDFSLVPLYVNSDIEDTQLRICLQIEDPERLEKFIVERIRKIKGVDATRVRLTLNGQIFPEGLNAMAKMSGQEFSCHIFVNTAAGEDEQVWEGLRRLKKDGDVFPVWIFRDFYEFDRAVTVRLIGKDVKLLRQYVEKHVGNIKGVNSWRLKFMHSVTQILENDLLLELARNWLKFQG